MSVYCNCIACGGDDPYAVCENVLMDIQKHKYNTGPSWGLVVAAVLCLVGMGLAGNAVLSDKKETPCETTQQKQEVYNE